MSFPTSASPRTAPRLGGLVPLLWAWYTVLSLVAALPAWGWLAGATGTAPEADVLLDGIRLGALVELLESSTGVFPLLSTIVAALVGLAVLSNAFLSGGVLAVLLEPERPRRLLPTFFHGAGRFFLRSLGLLVLTYVLFVVVCGAATAVLAPGLNWLLERAGEPGSAAWGVTIVAVVCVIAGVFHVSLDYSRVLLVRDDARAVVRTWLRGALFVVRHPLASLAPGVAYGAAIVVALAVGAWVGAAVSARSWSWNLLATLAQQAILIVAVWLRVAMLGAETATLGRLLPPAPAPEPVPEPAAEPTIVSEATPLP